MTVTTNATGAAGTGRLWALRQRRRDDRRVGSDERHRHHLRNRRERGLCLGDVHVDTPATPSTISITGATIATNGSTATGVLADLGGQVTVNGGSVTTNGGSSIGVRPTGSKAAPDPMVTLTGAMTVTTNATGAAGLDAYGLYANGGGTIDGSGATSVTVTTYGNGRERGLCLGDVLVRTPSTITIGGVATIATNGATAAGVEAYDGGHATLGAGTVTTSGATSPGIVASGANSLVTLNGASLLTVKTTTDGSIGLYALAGGVITATGPISISTGSTTGSTGLNAYGVNADGSGSEVNLAGTTIATTGQGAVGLYASDVTATGQRRPHHGLGNAERHDWRNHRSGRRRLWRVGAERGLHDRPEWREHVHDQRRRFRALRL